MYRIQLCYCLYSAVFLVTCKAVGRFGLFRIRWCMIFEFICESAKTYQCFIMPPPFIMGGHIASPLSVHPSVRTYIRTSRTYEKWFPGDIF